MGGQTQREKNKALVLEAFDTFFDKRGYARAETYWSPKSVRHSAHIERGRERLFKLIKARRRPCSTNPDRSLPTAISSWYMGASAASAQRQILTTKVL
jgi:MarR-like DNA-binding transcriptional regulator SgrR of sgrS sRNA